MEFFRIINIESSESEIKAHFTLNNIEKLSNQVFVIGDQNNEWANIGSVWGEFTLERYEIKGGLRFVLKECPNALCWTITTGFQPDKKAIILHLTINRIEKDAEFIEEIEEFLDDQSACISSYFEKQLNPKQL